MKRLSSQWTFFYKRMFPVIWFGFIALFVLLPWTNRRQTQGMPLPVFIVPVVMAVFGYLLFGVCCSTWSMEFGTTGTRFIVRNGGVESCAFHCRPSSMSASRP